MSAPVKQTTLSAHAQSPQAGLPAPREVRLSFDSVAPHYRWLEAMAFGSALQKARVAYLDQIDVPKRALIAGEGNGRYLEALLERHPETPVDCVDTSTRMLQLARKRIGEASCVRFLHEDLTVWSPGEKAYDLIVTHFFLDCFNEMELEMVVAKLSRAAAERATWLLADFSIPDNGLARIHARLWLQTMYAFFRLTTGISARKLIDPSPFLQAEGFRRRRRVHWRAGLVTSQMWERP
jgi:ubiquinone/menaquinone biosynthesis C-methylase UbiE